MEFSDYKTMNEVIDALNKKGVFEVERMDPDMPIKVDENGRLSETSRPYSVKVSIAEDVVLSKANFKRYASIAPSYEWSGYAKKKNADFRVESLKSLHEISDKNNKRTNEYHKEVLDGRLSGAYKEKYRNGQTWNSGGHEVGDAKARKEARSEAEVLQKSTVKIPPSLKECVDQAKANQQEPVLAQRAQARRL